jgi:hypothetical protein
MKMLNNKIKFSLGIITLMLALMVSSCEDVLDKEPITDFTSEAAFANPESYEQFMSKIYGGLAINGQDLDDADIQGIDGHFSNYVRLYYNLQELSTDEAIIAWNDGTIHDLHNQVWTPANEFISAMYYRIYFQIGLVNQFLRETTEDKLNSRGVDNALKAKIAQFRAEARFMRALSYWHGIDFFGAIPFVTEDDIVGNFFPEQKSRTEVFNYIESELLAIEPSLMAPLANELGRADKGAAWMLLAKIYLNAEVYTGSARYSDAMTYINNVIGGGYFLGSKYNYLFLADNESNGSQNESIFSVRFDGINITGWGGTTYITHAAVGGTMSANDFGIDGGWGGLRTTKTFVNNFGNDVNPVLGAPSEWGLVGGFNGWGGSPDLKMYETAPGQVAVYAYMPAGEFKMRLNESWDVNYGDNDPADGNLVLNGKNLNFEEDGMYYIAINTIDLTYEIFPYFAGDQRAMFHIDGQNLEIENPFSFTDGYAITKWRNVTVNGDIGVDGSGTFCDIDFPVFRLADAYLMYAEVFLRGGGGDASTAVGYINMIRERAYGSSAGDINSGTLSLEFIMEERSRELYWESHRRTDLIRFRQFSENGVWPWKGGVAQGRTTESIRDLYPIPSADIIANPNLTQNDGY